MSNRRGSWPPIVVLVVVFLGLFLWQRARSPFLAIEADRAGALAVATAQGLSVHEVMALRELIGAGAAGDAWKGAAAAFAEKRRTMGDALAAVAIVGHEAAATQALAAATDPDAAWAAFRTDVRAIAGLRFLAMRDRFRSRDRAQN